MATAGDLIKGSLRLIGQLAEGEIPTNETFDDSLSALNEMLDAWSIDSLTVYAQQDQTFTWPSATASRTLGLTGDLVGLRPVLVADSSYIVVNGSSYPLTMLNREQYNMIVDKDSTASYPTYFFVDMTVPNAEIFVYPVPTESIEIHIISALELTQPATILTTLVIPPGYQRAFRFNLACALAAEFGKEPPLWVMKTAAEAKGAIERINDPMHQLTVSFPGGSGNRRSHDINLGA